MSEIVLESVLVCPVCGFAKRETMPIKACQFFYECAAVRRCCAPKPATAASFVPMVRRSVRRCRAKTATCRAVERLRGVLLSRSRGPQLWLTRETSQWRTTIHRSCLCSLVHQPSGSTGAIRSLNLRRVRNGYARGKTSGKLALADTRGKRRTCYHVRYHPLFKSY